ncbi:unnamed protein product [Psylliodes chrysocephalus]|uniref:Fibroblast growth factor n=1 Tax=Psylliodes chrysocephalus TaxID=3402493 RepID=A0A9P0GE94_9CUCU|nr:unnamed protein product [Psylliodes chrysocephala]
MNNNIGNNIRDSAVISEDSSSEDDIDSSEDEGDCASTNGNYRDRRSLQWCPVDTYKHNQRNHNHPHHKQHHNHQHHIQPHHQLHHHPRHHPPVKVVWPPPSNATPSTSSSNQFRFSNVRIGNPKLGAKMQLYCKTGHHLAIYPDGKVRGTGDENDLHTYLELSAAGYPGHVRIRGLLTNLYIAMDRRGRLYGEADPMMESTVFIESFQGSYTAYLSRRYAHLGWYIGIKRNGKIKKGPLTGYGQKAVKFLPRRHKFE